MMHMSFAWTYMSRLEERLPESCDNKLRYSISDCLNFEFQTDIYATFANFSSDTYLVIQSV